MKNLLLFFSLLISASCFSQSNAKYWHKDSLLTWADFQGPLDPGVKFAAYTNANWIYEYHLIKSNSVTTAVSTAQSFFGKNKSWSNPIYRSADLLAHEQLHFDLAEYFARQFTESVNNRAFTDTARKEIRMIFTRIDGKLKDMQLLYDAETSHGANSKKQKQWEVFIANILEKNTPLEEMLKNIP